MATWVTHLMIADAVLKSYPWLDRKGFCVGNIAPDCNVENADWSGFTPSREVTHWMQGGRKTASDCEVFVNEYIVKQEIQSEEHRSFLIGYYSHLIADAEFQRMIREPERVAAAWERLKADPELAVRAKGMPETWDTFKILIPYEERMINIDTIEARYLEKHPDSGYLTEILPLKEFADYIDYLPQGAIVRKIGVMGKLPKAGNARFLSISREEYEEYIKESIRLVIQKIKEIG